MLHFRKNITLAPEFRHCSSFAENIESRFSESELLAKTKRNTLKSTKLDNQYVVIKRFGPPGIARAFIYRWFAKPKSIKAYDHAVQLRALGFDTPSPVAHIELTTLLRLGPSYYICQLLDHDYCIGDILHSFKKNDKSAQRIIESFTQFTFSLHEAGILHIDHNAGNTLIYRSDDKLAFSLIDINRMKFKKLSLTERLKNFTRLTDNVSSMKIIAHHYAKLSGEDPEFCEQKLLQLKNRHLRKIALKQKFKQMLKHS